MSIPRDLDLREVFLRFIPLTVHFHPISKERNMYHQDCNLFLDRVVDLLLSEVVPQKFRIMERERFSAA